MSDKKIDVLDEGCRPFIWQYTDPLFSRIYCWFPDEGSAAWWYSSGSGWFESVAGAGEVDSATISHGAQERGAYGFRRLGTSPLDPLVNLT